MCNTHKSTLLSINLNESQSQTNSIKPSVHRCLSVVKFSGLVCVRGENEISGGTQKALPQHVLNFFHPWKMRENVGFACESRCVCVCIHAPPRLLLVAKSDGVMGLCHRRATADGSRVLIDRPYQSPVVGASSLRYSSQGLRVDMLCAHACMCAGIGMHPIKTRKN